MEVDLDDDFDTNKNKKKTYKAEDYQPKDVGEVEAFARAFLESIKISIETSKTKIYPDENIENDHDNARSKKNGQDVGMGVKDRKDTPNNLTEEKEKEINVKIVAHSPSLKRPNKEKNKPLKQRDEYDENINNKASLHSQKHSIGEVQSRNSCNVEVFRVGNNQVIKKHCIDDPHE